jgi:Zn finger protein HypA/HybF involved in hydrogenase expression
MGDVAKVVCAFCGSTMGLGRAVAASADTHALRFFSCETCGASELRIDRDRGSGIKDRITSKSDP